MLKVKQDAYIWQFYLLENTKAIVSILVVSFDRAGVRHNDWPDPRANYLAGTFLAAEISSGQVSRHGDVTLVHDHTAVFQQRKPGVTHWERMWNVKKAAISVSTLNSRRCDRIWLAHLATAFGYLAFQPVLSFSCWPCCCSHSWRGRKWKADDVSHGAGLEVQS